MPLALAETTAQSQLEQEDWGLRRATLEENKTTGFSNPFAHVESCIESL